MYHYHELWIGPYDLRKEYRNNSWYFNHRFDDKLDCLYHRARIEDILDSYGIGYYPLLIVDKHPDWAAFYYGSIKPKTEMD